MGLFSCPVHSQVTILIQTPHPHPAGAELVGIEINALVKARKRVALGENFLDLLSACQLQLY